MNCANCERCPMALVFRWAGRVLGLAAFALVATFLVTHLMAGEVPDPAKLTRTESVLCLTLLGALVGMLVGWRWEVVGGLLVVGGMAAFFAVERFGGGFWPTGWVIWSLPLPGVLYLLASAFDACRTRHLGVTS